MSNTYTCFFCKINFFVYNVLPGTTSAAVVKANFLKEIILEDEIVDEISIDFAFELLSHMKGGQSIKVLIDLALGNNLKIADKAAEILKTQVFLYDADTERLSESYKKGNQIAKSILESYANAEFFTNLPELEEEIKILLDSSKTRRSKIHIKRRILENLKY